MSGTEIELKFDLAPEARAKLTAAAALAGVSPHRTTMRSLYFDTPERTLARREMALRLRREGRRWVQTLKAGRSGTGGLHQREEWEHTRPEPTLDLTLLGETPLARMHDATQVRERLAPVFEVNFTRTAWIIAPEPGCKLEVALDTGEVASGERTTPICEVEIECIEGDPARAFDLAARLMKEVALHPSAISKAQRGYRLARGEALQPVKATKLALDGAMTPMEAARTIVAAGVAQLQANEEGVLASSDPEFIHQARVALRRTRSALRMFRREIGVGRAKAWADALAETSRALGCSRDWDVFGTRTLPAALEAFDNEALSRSLKARVSYRRRVEREKAREAIRSPAYAASLLELARWLAHADGKVTEARSPETLPEFAERVIRKRHKALLTGALMLGSLSATERHRVRVDAKRLRYGLDALASLFRARPLASFAASVESMQEALGDCNDAATALALLEELHAPEPFAAYARGWFAARERGEPSTLEPIVAEIARHRRSWLKAP
ncbi:MAG TPA: CHAD domain-containing protein [Usitatibacter sp.]